MHQAIDSRFSRLAVALSAACLFLGSWGAAASQASFDPYVVSDLQITVAAEDAVSAKDRALDQAVEEGLERVLRRLTVQAQREKLPRASQALAHRLLDRLAIEAERFGSTRYSAKFRVAFSPLAVRGFLRRHGVQAVDQAAPPILLIPAHIENETPLLWEEADTWAAALRAVAFEDGLTPARLPNNSRADRAAPAKRILAAEQAVLEGFRTRYRAQGVVAVTAETFAGRDRTVLQLSGEDAAGPLDIREEVPSGGLRMAAERVAAVLSERWKSALTGTLADDARDIPGIDVRVLLHGGEAEWARIQRRLTESGTLEGLVVNRIGEQIVELTIWPSGDIGRLVERLAAHQLDLFEAGGTWLLQYY